MKQALIRDNDEPKHVPRIMIRKLRAHLVMDQIGMATGNLLTPNSLTNVNITPNRLRVVQPQHDTMNLSMFLVS